MPFVLLNKEARQEIIMGQGGEFMCMKQFPLQFVTYLCVYWNSLVDWLLF